MNKKITIIGEYKPASKTHIATNVALSHSIQFLNKNIDFEWVSSNEISEEYQCKSAGIFIAPGFYKNPDKVMEIIKFARENNIACLGTCGGFQFMVLEYAKNVLKIQNAAHEEYANNENDLVIIRQTCSLHGKTMNLKIEQASALQDLYGIQECEQTYYCNYGINPDYEHLFSRGDFWGSGFDENNAIRVLESKKHPFFMATLFVPQLYSKLEKPNKIITEFVDQSSIN